LEEDEKGQTVPAVSPREQQSSRESGPGG
jgi:hypothetical protein